MVILQKSPSLGIAGWSEPDLTVRDYGLIDSERRMRERQERSLGGSDLADDEDIEKIEAVVQEIFDWIDHDQLAEKEEYEKTKKKRVEIPI